MRSSLPGPRAFLLAARVCAVPSPPPAAPAPGIAPPGRPAEQPRPALQPCSSFFHAFASNFPATHMADSRSSVSCFSKMASSCKRTGSLSGPSFFVQSSRTWTSPQIAQLAEEFPPQLAHFPPGSVGVHLFHHRRTNGTAAAPRAGRAPASGSGDVAPFQFLQGALHPIAQPRCSEFEPAIVLPVPIFSQAGPNRGGPRP